MIWRLAFVLALAAVYPASVAAQDKDKKDAQTMTVVAADTADATGVLGDILPAFEKKTGVKVRVLSRGTGEMIEIVKNGRADVVILDDHLAEGDLLKDEDAIERQVLMYTELLVVGPRADPASIKGMVSAVDAVKAIAASESLFISRGDNSGISRVERRLWQEVMVDPDPARDGWYTRTEADMRTTLGLAAAKKGYTLTDMATWLRFDSRGKLEVLVADDPRLMLRYVLLMPNPTKFPTVKERFAKSLIDYMVSSPIQKQIGGFRIGGELPYSPHFDLKDN
jgi:tungstate transport system substrate-binding protein